MATDASRGHLHHADHDIRHRNSQPRRERLCRHASAHRGRGSSRAERKKRSQLPRRSYTQVRGNNNLGNNNLSDGTTAQLLTAQRRHNGTTTSQRHNGTDVTNFAMRHGPRYVDDATAGPVMVATVVTTGALAGGRVPPYVGSLLGVAWRNKRAAHCYGVCLPFARHRCVCQLEAQRGLDSKRAQDPNGSDNTALGETVVGAAVGAVGAAVGEVVGAVVGAFVIAAVGALVTAPLQLELELMEEEEEEEEEEDQELRPEDQELEELEELEELDAPCSSAALHNSTHFMAPTRPPAGEGQ